MKPIVFISSDNNPIYRDFFPICKKFWKHIGFIPIHLKIGSKQFPIVPKIPTSFQAQIVRLYASKFYPNDIIITTDIDILPLSKNYFIDKLPKNEKEVIVYTSNALSENGEDRFAMCYISSYGKNLSKIVLENENETWIDFVNRLNSLNLGWNTDELFITEKIKESNYNKILHKRVRDESGFLFVDRLSRKNWKINKNNFYVDAHCPRPYAKYKEEIDSLFQFIK